MPSKPVIGFKIIPSRAFRRGPLERGMKMALKILSAWFWAFTVLAATCSPGWSNQDEDLEPLKVSEPDTVTLIWKLYACGFDCPVYTITSVGLEATEGYLGQKTNLQGYQWQVEGDFTDEERDKAILNAKSDDKLVCRGRFKHFPLTPDWQCGLECGDSLIFFADHCDQVMKTVEDVFGRDLGSILLAAASGEPQALFDMARICSWDYWLPYDELAAQYWCILAALRGQEEAPYYLERYLSDKN